jgi:hypothetical protein
VCYTSVYEVVRYKYLGTYRTTSHSTTKPDENKQIVEYHPRSFSPTQTLSSRPEEISETAQSSTMNQQHFIQKTALITGGCGGLGRAIAEAFLRAGTNVVVCDINEGLMSDFREKVSSAYPECTLVLQADITKDDRVEEVFAEGEKMFGGIDFVVNSAGRIDRFDAVAELERPMWDKVIALNLTAPAVVSGRAIKKWLEMGRKGVIVNIASTAGFRGFNCGSSPTCPSGRPCTY